jgi:O-antigen/teichoic acid export membrane protein
MGGGGASLAAGRISSAVCGLIQVPVVLACLGAEGFGLWVALAGLLWTLGICDGGLGFALQNRLAALYAQQREQQAAVLLRRAVLWLTAVGAVLLAAGLPLAWWGRWDAWFGVTDPALRRQLPAAMAILFTAAAVALPLSLASRLAAARQRLWLSGMWITIGSVLGLIAAVSAARLKLPLPAFMAAACILPLVPNAGTWLHFSRELRLDPAAPQTADTRGLGKESGLFFLSQTAAALTSIFVPTLVALFAGPVAVAPYSVLQRLYALALQVQGMVLLPTWPAYTRAAALGDATFARRVFGISWVVTLAGFALPVLAFTPWAPGFVRLWLGPHAPELPGLLLWSIAGWHVLQFCGQPAAMLLNGLGRIAPVAMLGWVGMPVALGLCTILGPRWGAVGVIAALAVPYLLLYLPWTGWQAYRALVASDPGKPGAPALTAP